MVEGSNVVAVIRAEALLKYFVVVVIIETQIDWRTSSCITLAMSEMLCDGCG